MRHALVFYPELRHAGIDALRARHDPTARLIHEHLTLVFPLPEAVGREALSRHVHAVAAGWAPFRLHLVDLERSWDHWLFLAAREGAREAVALHDALYGGMLAPYLRADLPYTPHVGLGLFARGPYDPLDPQALPCDEAAYRRARAQAEALALDFWRVVERVTLVALGDDLSTVQELEVVPLEGGPGEARS